MKNYKTFTKRLSAAAAALAIALCACGCGEKETNTNGDTGAAVNAGTKTEAAPASGTTKAAAKTEAAADGAADAKDAEAAEAEGETKMFAADEAFDGVSDIAMADTARSDVAEPSKEAAPGIWTEENGVEQTAPSANILTAGEWNDNDNWGFFENLISSGTIEFPAFGIDPRNRTAVHVTDKDGQPVANAEAQLVAEGDMVLWDAVTDKNGDAYLFAPEGGYETLEVTVSANGNSAKAQVRQAKAEDSGQGESSNASQTVEITLDEKTNAYKNTEIKFIVDATGSMADEMLFLQSEFSAIAEEVGTENVKYSVDFYRDEGDEYVTKCSEFTDDISRIQSLLNSESADGGGDVPEAVAQILDETITNGQWSEDSVKLAFLIFDAPPHDGTDETLKAAVMAAASKGIRIIPVVSSNAERATELFARAVSICTGGTYVFLTDDSGVGDSHLEPIIGDYEVEKLYDIIIRIIDDYRQ